MTDNQVGCFMLSFDDLCENDVLIYGPAKFKPYVKASVRISNSIGIVRAALKKAKANL